MRRTMCSGALLAVTLAVLSLPMWAQFRTVTVENAPSNPVPVNVTNLPSVTGAVTVNNTGANPVPVAGTVAISGTPAVNINGTPTVNVVNLPLTNDGATANGAVAFKNVDEPARQPFALAGNVNLAAGINVNTFVFPPLALGRRYVILSVSVNSFISKGTDTNWIAFVNTNSSGTPCGASFAVPNVLPGYLGGADDVFAVTQPVYVTPDPNSQIGIGIQRIGTTGTGFVTFTLT